MYPKIIQLLEFNLKDAATSLEFAKLKLSRLEQLKPFDNPNLQKEYLEFLQQANTCKEKIADLELCINFLKTKYYEQRLVTKQADQSTIDRTGIEND
jgi:hypothetical protein